MKMILGLLCAMLAVWTPVYAKKPKQLPEVTQVASATDLTPELIQEILAGVRPEVAIELEKGTRLPIKFSGNYKIFSVKYDPHLVFKAEKRCYLRVVKSKAYLSYDLKNWMKPDLFDGIPDVKIGMSRDKSHLLIEQAFLSE